MKRISLLLVSAALLLASCSSPLLTATDSAEGALDGSRASATVTTEAALKNAVNNAVAGDTIKISGTIYLTSSLQLLKSGTSSKKINLTGGVLDGSRMSSGWVVKCNGSYWNITNMVIQNGPDCGLVFQTGGNNYVYNVHTRYNKDTGLQIYNGSYGNYIYNCKSYDNYDTQNGGENADGYAPKLSAGRNNKFQNCYAYNNSDDGWDLYGQPYTVTITKCEAYSNGRGTNGDGNGFKLGSAGQKVPHTVTYCKSYNNKGCGYDGNGNTGHITITGSTASGNAKTAFYRIY